GRFIFRPRLDVFILRAARVFCFVRVDLASDCRSQTKLMEEVMAWASEPYQVVSERTITTTRFQRPGLQPFKSLPNVSSLGIPEYHPNREASLALARHFTEGNFPLAEPSKASSPGTNL
ncbi:uncharacterized, partial [Tachysurus ichikawai]